MNSYRKPSSGTAAYEQWLREQDLSNSALTKMQKQFWVTKQAVYKKLGKKEDECVVASDSELDAKLELFRSIQQSCADLQRIIERYQERLCNLSQEENGMGRFLKESGRTDKTRAGKIMTTAGKSMSYCGQQRLSLRTPLMRLHQEVETFRRRAIEDTLQNVHAMEKSRTEYRASLNWMKEVSQQLDPDTNKQMERFRKVQTQVRRSKARFDQHKLDCLQKVDLLAASRCNMFSHALILYQSSLIAFAQNASKTFSTVANSFKGYQHYEFSVVKELAEPSLKLAEETGQEVEEEKGEEATETPQDQSGDKDQMFFFESEYRDESAAATEEAATSSPGLADLQQLQEVLLDLGPPTASSTTTGETSTSQANSLLEDLFSDPLAGGGSSAFGPEWQAVFGASGPLVPSLLEESGGEAAESFLPSRLLDSWASAAASSAPSTGASLEGLTQTQGGLLGSMQAPPVDVMETLSSLSVQQSVLPSSLLNKKESTSPSVSKSKSSAADMSAWFNVFADLDPLANPDAVGRQPGQEEEQRNC